MLHKNALKTQCIQRLFKIFPRSANTNAGNLFKALPAELFGKIFFKAGKKGGVAVRKLLEKLVKREESEVEIEDFLNNLHTRTEDPYENADAFVMPIDVAADEDTSKVVEEAKKWNVLLLNIGTLQARNPVRLKGIISRIREGIEEIDGDIARLTEEIVIVTPSRVKILKRK